MYGNSSEASLLRQAKYLREEVNGLLEVGDYKNVYKKLSHANQCIIASGETLEEYAVIEAMHYFLMAKAEE